MRLQDDVSEEMRSRIRDATFPVRLEEPEPVRVRVQGVE